MTPRAIVSQAHTFGTPDLQALADNADKALAWAIRWRGRVATVGPVQSVNRRMMRDSALRYRRSVAILARSFR